MTLNAIRPAHFPWFRYEGYSFSLGLTHGADAWLSGHSASEHDPESGRMVVRGGMTDQTRTAYRKIEAILEAAGLTFADVTKITENVTVHGLDHYPEAEAVRREIFGEHRPAVTTVVVERLLRPAAFIEIEVHAGPGGPKAVTGDGVAETADGAVFLPTVLPVDERGEVVSEGDLIGQYAYCLDKADRLLRGAGLSLDAAVTTYDYTTPATRDVYRRTHRARKERLGGAGVYPGAGGILMSRLHRPGVLVALDVTASRHPLEAVNPGWSRYDTLTYTPGVKAGGMLWMSGFAALDMETQEALHPGDVVAQAEVTYDAIGQVLAAAGAGPEHLISTIEFVCPDGLADYRGVADVRKRRLREPWPASTGALCAGLLRPEFLLEVFPAAVLP
ncbi:RidA family protein [Nonomuraea sp. MCN248]|uniref:RidA family protein n=1 Tax=Nonomuraea corallina TaxID=2989783 RepID=A0ABT4SGI4_9ACTN|nr:RidA family protein [Nonomuraea corallina]MDA0636324.1 RidA family protein [Nonomuraea corallina]